jgi:hypothetical protein
MQAFKLGKIANVLHDEARAAQFFAKAAKILSATHGERHELVQAVISTSALTALNQQGHSAEG